MHSSQSVPLDDQCRSIADLLSLLFQRNWLSTLRKLPRRTRRARSFSSVLLALGMVKNALFYLFWFCWVKWCFRFSVNDHQGRGVPPSIKWITDINTSMTQGSCLDPDAAQRLSYRINAFFPISSFGCVCVRAPPFSHRLAQAFREFREYSLLSPACFLIEYLKEITTKDAKSTKFFVCSSRPGNGKECPILPLLVLLGKMMLSLFCKWPPGKRRSAFHKMDHRHKHIDDAGIMPWPWRCTKVVVQD